MPNHVSNAIGKARIWTNSQALLEAFNTTLILAQVFAVQICTLYGYMRGWPSWKKDDVVFRVLVKCIIFGTGYPQHIIGCVHGEQYIVCKSTHQWFDVILDEVVGIHSIIFIINILLSLRFTRILIWIFSIHPHFNMEIFNLSIGIFIIPWFNTINPS